MYTADLESISEANLLSLHDISLPDPSVCSKRGFNPNKMGANIELLSPTELRYKGTESDWSNTAFADWAITESHEFAYFEVTINQGDSSSQLPEVAIGFGSANLDPNEMLPGWHERSWGFHSDDGSFFCGEGWASMSLRLRQGETLGMGFIRATSEFFVTSNGQFLGVGCIVDENIFYQEDPDKYMDLYAMVGVRTRGTSVSVNFGQHPFKFDFNVDSITFSSHKYLTRRPTELDGHFSPKRSTFYWMDVDHLISLKTNSKKLQSHVIKYPPLGSGAPDMFEHTYQSAIIDDHIWLLNLCESTSDNLFPLFKIWSINLADFEAQYHVIDSSHLTKKLPETYPDYFTLNANEDGKIYFINPPEDSSFYFDTRDLSIHEIDFHSAPTSYFSTFLLDGNLFTASRPWELPYGALSMSVFENGDWKSVRQTGPPVRSRYDDVRCNYKNSLIVLGGSRNEHMFPDFDIITVKKLTESKMDEEGGTNLSFLLTPAGLALSDVSLHFSDGKILASHKSVLYSRSERFRTLLMNNPKSNSLQIDFPYEPLFKYVVEYLYTDAIEFTSETVNAQQLASLFDFWIPEHSLRACEYISLNRVITRSSMSTDLLRLLNDSYLPDITLKVDDSSFAAHKTILVARSDYFRAMLLSGLSEGSQDIIQLPGVSSDVFRVVLAYIYSSATEFIDDESNADLIVETIIAASRLQVEGLIQYLEAIIGHNLDAENVESMIELAEMHNLKRLKASCIRWKSNQIK